MTVPDVAAAGRNQVPLGIAYMAGSTAMFAGGNAVVKWQLATYPLGEVAFGRTLFAFLTVATIVLPRAGWRVLRTRRYREHLQRGLSQFGSMLCWFLAVSVLSLGSATAIGFAAPLFTTLLSIRDPEGEGQHPPLVGASRRVYRRSDHRHSGSEPRTGATR
jgi:drug/metabolite transporter (DMT)-like permease